MWEVRRLKTYCTSLPQCKVKMGEERWKGGEKAEGTLGGGHGVGLPKHKHPS